MAFLNPYTSRPSSVIRADFSQGSIRYSDSSRGRQCLTNGLMFLVHTVRKQVKALDKQDLHTILDAGDHLYRSIHATCTSDLLLASDLPRCICLNNQYYHLQMKKSYVGCMNPGFKSVVGLSLENSLNVLFSRFKTALLVFHASAIAIRYENGMYYVFDSHSRGSNSLCHPDGNCVLSILPSFAILVGFFRSLCYSLSSTPLQHVQFELHPLHVTAIKKKLPECHVVIPSNVSETSYMNMYMHHPVMTVGETVSGSQIKDVPLPFFDQQPKQLKKCSKGKPTNVASVATVPSKNPPNNTSRFEVKSQKHSVSPERPIASGSRKRPANTTTPLATGSRKRPTLESKLKSPKLSASSTTRIATGSQKRPSSTTLASVTPDSLAHTGPKKTCFQKVLIEKKNSDRKSVIEQFKRDVSEGPTFICSCCTQTWFRNSVQKVGSCPVLKSDFAKSCLVGVKSAQNCEWICNTCFNNLKKGKVPACAVVNGMGFPVKPSELDITEMEERLISPRIPFMQLYEKPRGGQRSLRGNVVNVPTDVTTTAKSLPRTLANTETIQVKLKRRLSNKHSVMYESIRPNRCIAGLKWLLENSAIFQSEGITLNENWNLLDQDNWYDRSDVTGNSKCANYEMLLTEQKSDTAAINETIVDGHKKECSKTQKLHLQNDEVNSVVGHSNSTCDVHAVMSNMSVASRIDSKTGITEASMDNRNLDFDIDTHGDRNFLSKMVDSQMLETESQNLSQERQSCKGKEICVTSISVGHDANKDFVTRTYPEGNVVNTSDSDHERDDEDSDGWTEARNFEDRPTGNTDTLLHPVDVRGLSKTFSFAPGEGQTPLGLYQDKDAEYLSFPTIYCGQKRPDNKERKTPVHYSTISKWELRCHDRRAACSIPNIFFKLKKLQIKQIQDKVSLAMRKCEDGEKKPTVGDILKPSSFDNIVRLNEGYRVLRTLRGSPAYWEQAKKDIFAMIRQLGIPTWFCSLSAAETKWINLLKDLAKLVKNKIYTNEEAEAMSWLEKCELIKSDPVTCARYFNNRVQVFINTILKGDLEPVGKVKDFFYRVEFQQRGSPHIHMLIWILNAPVYGKSSNREIENFIDRYSTCSKESDRPDLINYQTHRHARTCRKKGKAVCRFGFPLPPMPHTTILEPLNEEDHKTDQSAAANFIKICEMLNTMNMGESISFKEFLEKLEMTQAQYMNAIRSSLTSSKIFLKRMPSEIRINSYNPDLLESWEANIDVQFILDAYACASYIVSYISKGQRGMSNLLYQACKDVRKGNFDLKQQVRHIGNKFLTHVEVCAQEAAYLILQMPLRMSSRSVVFINTSEAKDRTFLLKPLRILEDMPMQSSNIESDNYLKRYQRRPKELEMCCLADFVSKFDTILPKRKEKAKKLINQAELPEDDNEQEADEEILVSLTCDGMLNDTGIDKENLNVIYKDEYCLKDGSVLKKRKTTKVIRFVRYSKVHDSENYFREQLMLFLPWRDEVNDLLGAHDSFQVSYAANVDRIKSNKKEYESDNANVVEQVEDECQQLLTNSQVVAPGAQHDDEVDGNEKSLPSALHGCFDPGENIKDYDLALDLGITRKQISKDDILVNDMSNDDYIQLARSLNQKQAVFFNHVLHWFKTKEVPLHCFLTGGAGVGKSIVTTALYQAVTRFFQKGVGNCPDDIKAVLCAPTGKAAHNIGGLTIHSLFCIPASQGFKYKPLDSQQLDSFRVKFRALKVVFIDEISMVGNRMFNYINCRLQEIFANHQPFGGTSIIAIGDLFQLKPVMDGWIFDDLWADYGPLAVNLWVEHFKMFELTEIMRQKEDKLFSELLNRLREGLHNHSDLENLKDRILETGQISSVSNKPHLFTTNAEVNAHNTTAYENADSGYKCIVQAIDTVSGDVSEDVKDKVKNQIPDDPTKTMGLIKTVQLAEHLPAEVCVNIDVEDGLTNGTPGIVKKLDMRVCNSNRCSIVWVHFEEKGIGANARTKYSHLYVPGICKTWTPVLEITRRFSVGKSQSCFVTRRQFPLRLAAAKTVHKSQGSTMATAVLHFGKRRQEHMHYVGLSRIRKLQNVHILALNEEKIAISKDVVHEMNRLRECANLQSCVPILGDIDTDFKIVYHNSRSLHLHKDDLLAQKNMLSADIIVITETRLQPSDSSEPYRLEGFQMYRADEEGHRSSYRPYKGTVVFSKKPLQKFKSCVIFGIETVFATFYHNDDVIQSFFIYSPPKFSSISNLSCFMESIMEMCDDTNPLIVMGDTNLDFMTQSTALELISQRYQMTQIMHSITTDYGSCLDHIYTRNFSQNQISCATLESYYSDHKPIVAYLPY